MKKLNTVAAIAASAIAIGGAMTATAQAQPWRHGYYNDRSDDRLATPYVSGLVWKINNAARQGWISWGEARRLREEAIAVQPLSYRYQIGTARPDEVRHLAAVVDRIDRITSGYAYNDYRRRDSYGDRRYWR